MYSEQHLLGRLADGIVKILRHRGLDRDETGDATDRNPAVTGRARHLGVDLGDDGACGQHGGLRESTDVPRLQVPSRGCSFPNTVKSHLGKVFAKLGITARGQLQSVFPPP